MTGQEIEPIRHAARLERDVVDGWARQVQDVARLADYIAQTDFVPEALRNQPAAVAAAILAGREIGLGPMASLQHLHVIKGRPSMSAQMMRALVLAAGHTIRVHESTTTRCVLVGARRGGPEQAVTWTMDDARKAGINGHGQWQTYPRQMLLARATAELCRAMFPDVLGGMAYTPEEADDMTEATVAPLEAPTPTRTVRRTRKAATPKTPPPADVQTEAPPLPAGEPREMTDSATVAMGHDGRRPSPPDTPPAMPGGDRLISPDQRAALHARLREWGRLEPRSLKLRTLSGLAGRELVSTAQLTPDEITGILDTLAYLGNTSEPEQELSNLVTLGWANIERARDHTQPPLFDSDPPE